LAKATPLRSAHKKVTPIAKIIDFRICRSPLKTPGLKPVIDLDVNVNVNPQRLSSIARRPADRSNAQVKAAGPSRSVRVQMASVLTPPGSRC